MKIDLKMGFLNLNRCNMTWHIMMHLMQSIASKERRKKLLYRQATVIERTTVLGTSDKCTNEEGKWCCITYGTSGQHHNIEWCNNIVDQGVIHNSYETQDITIKRTMHVSHDDVEGIIIIHVKWVHLKHIWHNMSRWSICMYGKQGCKRKERDAPCATYEGYMCKKAPSPNNASSNGKVNSTILFLIFF